MNSEEYMQWAKKNNVFVSSVIYRLPLPNRSGVYILNSSKFNWTPHFYGTFRSYWIECGFSWLGYMVEFQYNK
jgi:hypothetical protein